MSRKINFTRVQRFFLSLECHFAIIVDCSSIIKLIHNTKLIADFTDL